MLLLGCGLAGASAVQEVVMLILLALAPLAPAAAGHTDGTMLFGSRHLMSSARTAQRSPRLRPSPAPAAGIPIYNTVMAWQQIAPLYNFAQPGESSLLEAARISLSMGMPTFKFSLDVTKYPNATRHIPGVDFTAKNLRLRDIVSQHPDVVQSLHAQECIPNPWTVNNDTHIGYVMVHIILNMPFQYFVMWAYTPGMDIPQKSIDKFVTDKAALQLVYDDFYNVTDYLLTKFAGSGKTFLLGNWEGDWALVLEQQKGHLRNPQSAAGMIKWMQARQDAVDAAKKYRRPTGVEVYNYLELNHVHALLSNPDFQCAANLVLPYVTVDFVSLSCYDVMGSSYQPQTNNRLLEALNLLEQQIPKKNLTNYVDPTGKAPAPFLRRAFIGEYGYLTGPGGDISYSEAGKRAAKVARDVITWGAPFCLYWQLYNNDAEAAKHNSGWMMVDSQGVQLPTYKLHVTYTANAQAWVQSFQAQNNRLPTAKEFAKQARYFF